MKVDVRRIQIEPWSVNCYVLLSGGEAAVIDPAGSIEQIERDIQGARLRWILCTHGHYDHVAVAAQLCERAAIPCSVHRDDRPLLRQAPLWAFRFERRSVAAPSRVDAFEAREVFPIGDAEIRVIHTPGHTPGSVCFAFGDTIATGDTLLRERPGRTDLPGADTVMLERSIGGLCDLPGDARLLPGHGEDWSLADARRWWHR